MRPDAWSDKNDHGITVVMPEKVQHYRGKDYRNRGRLRQTRDRGMKRRDLIRHLESFGCERLREVGRYSW